MQRRNAWGRKLTLEARNGRKIQAIKWYRSLYGVGLKDAKEAVERMLKEG